MTSGTSNPELGREIESILADFKGSDSLKEIFWDVLSYDRIRDPIPLTVLPESALTYTRSLEVFAGIEALAVVIAEVKFFPDGGRLEQMIWALKRFLADCVVLLTDSNSWLIVYPDESLKPRVRILPLPGRSHERAGVAAALAAMNAIEDGSGEELGSLALAESLGAAFPGATPNIGDLLTDFERLANHPSPEFRELWPFMREAGRYPLLTPEQERGEDLTGLETAPDGVDLPYYQWRLVVHNLRLVVWIPTLQPTGNGSATGSRRRRHSARQLQPPGCSFHLVAGADHVSESPVHSRPYPDDKSRQEPLPHTSPTAEPDCGLGSRATARTCQGIRRDGAGALPHAGSDFRHRVQPHATTESMGVANRLAEADYGVRAEGASTARPPPPRNNEAGRVG